MKKRSNGNIFTEVESNPIPRSTFDLSHTVTTTTNMGRLTPVLCRPVIPGDRFKGGTRSLVRFAPMISPPMGNVKVTFHYWYVPDRLSWASYEDFYYQGIADDIPAFPTLSGVVSADSNLAGYLGLPTGTIVEPISALPFAAYQRIYNEYYRDQNLVEPVPFTDLVDGDNSGAMSDLTALRNRAWGHDYFTACLPEPQKGDPVLLPLTGSASIVYNNQPNAGFQPDTLNWGSLETINSTDPDLSVDGAVPVASGSYTSTGLKAANSAQSWDVPASIDNSAALTADLSTAESIDVNTLRTAIATQQWLELNNRAGTRYPEATRAHHGARSRDQLKWRPQYIGGSVSQVTVSEVLQTSTSTGSDTPLGEMAGHGYALAAGEQFEYECDEHGYIICIMSILPDTSYQQGLPRHWTKFEPTDYADPKFASLGEQAVLKKEVYYDSTDGENDNTFGYIPRFSEYKYQPSLTTGAFRSSMAFWTWTRIFGSRPGLNGTFITSDPTTRPFAVIEDVDDHLWCQIIHQIELNCSLPFFGTPGLRML